jgi:hypothetical protein
MLTTLEKIVTEAEGTYVSSANLELLTSYSKNFALRMQTYLKIQKFENDVLRTVASTINDEMAMMLRSCAMAMLLDDKVLLKERYSDWLVERTNAWGRTELVIYDNQLLQKALARKLNSTEAGLIQPFVQAVLEVLQAANSGRKS